MRKFFKMAAGWFQKKSKGTENHEVKHVEGWAIFNAWVDRIASCEALTKKERSYILSRIDDELNNGERPNNPEYWNKEPVKLIAMWSWSYEDRERGVEKASRLGL